MKAIEDITHQELYAWRKNGETDALPDNLKTRLEQYFSIHRLYIDSTSRHQISKIIRNSYKISQKEFDHIFPLAIRYFNSEKKLSEEDFIYIQYEKFNKAIKALWMAGDVKGYLEAVEQQTKTCKPKSVLKDINPEDIKQHIFILTSDASEFYDRPTQKEIMEKIISFKKTHDISDNEVKKLLKDAGVTDVDYEEILSEKEDD